MDKSPLLMGKLTISMAIFNSYVSHYQRGCTPFRMPPSGRGGRRRRASVPGEDAAEAAEAQTWQRWMSMDWFKGYFFDRKTMEKPHISWEKPWVSCIDFP